MSAARLVLVAWEDPDGRGARDLLRRFEPAGVVLAGEALVATAAATRRLGDELRGQAVGPFFVAADLATWRPAGVEPFPALGTIGAEHAEAGDELEVTLLALERGRALAAAGVDLALGPRLDLADPAAPPDPDGPTLGADPVRTGALGAAFVEGLHAAGVLAAPGAFPGAGLAHPRAHRGAVQLAVDVPDEVLRERELVPFGAAIAHGLEALEVAAVLYPAWDPDLPALLSPVILGEVLRGELGFGGLVLAPDPSVLPGIRDEQDVAEAAVTALAAGCDLVRLGGPRERDEEVLARLADRRVPGRVVDERRARVASVAAAWEGREAASRLRR